MEPKATSSRRIEHFQPQQETGPGLAEAWQPMTRWSGTTRRLLFAFGSLVAFIGAAAYFAMAAIWQMHDALHAVKTGEEAVRGALELATAVRDQYAHQAHTIILGNASHLEMYEEARERVVTLTRRVRDQSQVPEERALANEIERSSEELDTLFRQQILPAVLSRDSETVQREHARALEIVWAVQARTDRLAESFEHSIGDFSTHAHVIEHTAFKWNVLFLGASILFAIAVGLYIRRSVARPVAELEAGALRIASGDLNTRIDIDSPDEFGRLAAQFNAMTVALKEHQEQLVRTEKLAGIGRLAAGVAHEINNPLGVILGYVRVMRRAATNGIAKDLAIIEEEAVRCQQIVEGLLDLSRASTPPPAEVDMRELCDDVVARLRESEAIEDVTVTVEGKGTATGSPQKLRQVVTNLIKNAVEAAGPHGSVRIHAGASRDWVTLSVADSGPGIAPEVNDRLFEPFFTTKPRGTGLGLAVSQAIARAHGGSIEVDRSPSGGALFTLRLRNAAEEGA
jgi:signal transduction histidine kinase